MSDLSFGQWLKRRRAGLGLTQAELADAVGYSREMIRKLEVDRLRPSKALAVRLAAVLQLPPEDHAAFIRFARDEGSDPPPPLPTQTTSVPPPSTLDASRSTSAPLPHNLPIPPTPLVGREAETRQVASLLHRPDVRLVTLTGPGGSGKTRLALEVAHTLTKDRGRKTEDEGRNTKYALRTTDGVFFVNLAPITDPSLVIATIAQALDVRESGGRPLLESVKDYLREKEMLLLLDNFEQVVEAAPIVADLLAYAPGLKCLVTSRIPLHLRGEKEFLVEPLPLPSRDSRPLTVDGRQETDYAARITQYAAVALFIQRAQDVKADFQVTNENAPAVAEICHRLDGLPLAIELAAARARVLTPEAMLPRLQRRLAFLTSGPADLPARQQTLRATIDWSFSLLTAGEQALFTRLAVFHGGFTLEAAEALCGDDDGGRRTEEENSRPSSVLHLPSVLDGVESLVAQSLVRRALRGSAEAEAASLPFTMLETIREYALDRFAASPEAGMVRQRHAQYYLGLVEEAEPQLMGAGLTAWLGRLGAEWENIRAAVGWLRDSAQPEALLRLVGALRRFCELQGRSSEALAWLEEGLNQGGEVAAAVRAKALHVASNLAQNMGDLDGAVRLGEASLALRRELGDQQGMARTLNNLAVTAWSQGNFSQARELHAASLAIKRALNDRLGMAYSLNNLGLIATDQDDYPTARALLEESLTLRRELGDQHGVAVSLLNLGNVARQQGQLGEARALYEQSLAQLRRLGDRANEARVQSVLGLTLAEQGDYAAAFAHLQASLDLRRTLGNKRDITVSLNNLGQAALYQGDVAWARLVFEDALGLAREGGAKMGQANALVGLGQVALAEGRWEDSRRYLLAGLDLQRELGDQGGVATTLLALAKLNAHAGDMGNALARARESLGELHRLGLQLFLADALETLVGLLGRGDPDGATRLGGAAAALRARLGIPLPRGAQGEWARRLDELRGALGGNRFEALYQTGHTLPLTEAVAEALAD
ncbi:MAG: tetratricopeptide repeat protein [Anaerolineae bacterium]|nr:tetratricopeptide repeat protein [Anaerolineae bacterium]